LARHLTGFDEEVQLGQLGEILENDTIVMTVELTDERGEPTRPDEEALWRGVTMLKYQHGRWHRQTKGTQAVVSFKNDPLHNKKRLIHQKIKLEPIDSNTLFGIRPILDASSVSHALAFSTNDGTLFRSDALFRSEIVGGAYDYEVTSDRTEDAAQPHEALPNMGDNTFLSMPADLRARLKAIAEPIVANIKTDGREGITARARALEAYLRDSGHFTYTLRMEIDDPKLDPVEDFLVNRKAGHCEYFASALALLLRSIDIQSRMVNGFKGGDWNDLTETLNVRQKHAHSWVEAYVGLSGPDKSPVWITLDPTPVQERQRSIAQVGGLAANFRPLTDSIRHIWIFYVVGYDGDRQERLIYGPMRTIATEVRNQYMDMGRRLRGLFARVFHFENPSAFISVRGFFVSFIVLSLAAGLSTLVYRLIQRILGWLRGPTPDATSLTLGTLFYRRLVQLLSEYDLERSPTETQGEFALRAHKFLTAQGPQSDPVADVPREVVEAFYRIRFGHLQLEPEFLDALNCRLDALEQRLKSP
jgi:transglutaminase-like putative cysteine protease